MNKLLIAGSGLLFTACSQLPLTSPVASSRQATFDGAGYPVEVCDASYAGTASSCNLSGSGQAQRIKGIVISGGKVYVGGELRVEADGRISAAGCQVPAKEAVSIDCRGTVVSAGFMNLHEHIDYSYQQPAQDPTQRWTHRHDWRSLTAQARGFEGDAPKDETVRAEVSELAMLRHQLSGSTALSGAKDYRAFTRNLKLTDPVLGTPQGATVQDSTFPLNDFKTNAQLSAPCTAEQLAGIRLPLPNPYVPHVGEGTTTGARYEVDCLLDAVKPKTSPNAFIHGVAISEAQISRFVQQQVSVVLSPRSNFVLYGATAPVPAMKAAGVNLAMGTDWSPSGSLTMLDEMRCMANHSRQDLHGLLSWSDIHRMATSGGAKAVGLQDQLGALTVGQQADIVLLDSQGATSLGQALERAALAQTVAVFIGGKAANFPTVWAGRLPQTLAGCASDPRDLCGQQRTVCGADPAHPLGSLLQQAVYTINDAKLCQPQAVAVCARQ
ncbi:amidohydrolase family protein [Chitinimonas naiadis]